MDNIQESSRYSEDALSNINGCPVPHRTDLSVHYPPIRNSVQTIGSQQLGPDQSMYYPPITDSVPLSRQGNGPPIPPRPDLSAFLSLITWNGQNHEIFPKDKNEDIDQSPDHTYQSFIPR